MTTEISVMYGSEKVKNDCNQVMLNQRRQRLSDIKLIYIIQAYEIGLHFDHDQNVVFWCFSISTRHIFDIIHHSDRLERKIMYSHEHYDTVQESLLKHNIKTLL